MFICLVLLLVSCCCFRHFHQGTACKRSQAHNTIPIYVDHRGAPCVTFLQNPLYLHRYHNPPWLHQSVSSSILSLVHYNFLAACHYNFLAACIMIQEGGLDWSTEWIYLMENNCLYKTCWNIFCSTYNSILQVRIHIHKQTLLLTPF